MVRLAGVGGAEQRTNGRLGLDRQCRHGRKPSTNAGNFPRLRPKTFAAELGGFARFESVDFCGELRRQQTRRTARPDRSSAGSADHSADAGRRARTRPRHQTPGLAVMPGSQVLPSMLDGQGLGDAARQLGAPSRVQRARRPCNAESFSSAGLRYDVEVHVHHRLVGSNPIVL